MSARPISVNELKYAFLSLKTNKFLEHDKINFHVVRTCVIKIFQPLKYLFNLVHFWKT